MALWSPTTPGRGPPPVPQLATQTQQALQHQQHPQQPQPPVSRSITIDRSRAYQAAVLHEAERTADRLVAEHNTSMQLDVSTSVPVDVYVRCRPIPHHSATVGLSEYDMEPVVALPVSGHEIAVQHDSKVEAFDVDMVFSPKHQQDDVYRYVGWPLVLQVLEGLTCCVILYGQSGSGKSYTLHGATKADPRAGLIGRAAADIFEGLRRKQAVYNVLVSAFELGSSCTDLLSDKTPTAAAAPHATARGISSVSQRPVSTVQDVLIAVQEAKSHRTLLHSTPEWQSDAGHIVFTISVSYEDERKGTQLGVLQLVDVAGFHRVTQPNPQHRSTIGRIHQDLLSLGRMISSVVKQQQSGAIRESPLTTLLEYALGGMCKTAFIVHVSPIRKHVTETTTSLSLGRTVRFIQNQVQDPLQLALEALARQYRLSYLGLRPLAMSSMLGSQRRVQLQWTSWQSPRAPQWGSRAPTVEDAPEEDVATEFQYVPSQYPALTVFMNAVQRNHIFVVGRAWERWRAMVHASTASSEHRSTMLARVIKRMRLRLIAQSWRSWVIACSTPAVRPSVADYLSRVSSRHYDRRLCQKVFGAWKSHVVAVEESRKTMVRVAVVMSAHRLMARCLRQWTSMVSRRARLRAVIHAASRKTARERLASGFAQWVQVIALSRAEGRHRTELQQADTSISSLRDSVAGVQLAATDAFARRSRQRILQKCMSAWKVQTASHRRAMSIATIAQQSRSTAALLRALSVWRTWYQRRLLAKALLRRVCLAQSKRALAAAVSVWRQSVMRAYVDESFAFASAQQGAHAEQLETVYFRLARFSQKRTRKAFLASVFHSWYSAAMKQRLQSTKVQCLRALHNSRNVRRVWQAWAGHVATAKQQRAALVRLSIQRRRMWLAQSFQQWRRMYLQDALATTLSQAQVQSSQALSEGSRIVTLSRCWHAWRRFSDRNKQLRHHASVVQAWCRTHRLRAALSSWQSLVHQRRAAASLLQRYATRLKLVVLSRRFHAWARFAHSEQAFDVQVAIDDQLQNSLRELQSVTVLAHSYSHLNQHFQRWKDFSAASKRRKAALAHALRSSLQRSTRVALHLWHFRCQVQARLQQHLRLTLSRQLTHRQRQALAQWQSYTAWSRQQQLALKVAVAQQAILAAQQQARGLQIMQALRSVRTRKLWSAWAKWRLVLSTNIVQQHAAVQLHEATQRAQASVTLVRWKSALTQRRLALQAMAHIFTRWSQQRKSAGFHKWHACVAQAVSDAQLSSAQAQTHAVLERLQGTETFLLAVCDADNRMQIMTLRFRMWKVAVQMRIARRQSLLQLQALVHQHRVGRAVWTWQQRTRHHHVLSRLLTRWQKAQLSCCWKSWQLHTLQSRHEASMSAVQEAQYARVSTAISSIFARQNADLLVQCFRAWKASWVMRARQFDSMKSRLAQQRMFMCMRRVFRAWQDYSHEQRQFQATMRNCIRTMYRQQVGRAWRTWCSNAQQRAYEVAFQAQEQQAKAALEAQESAFAIHAVGLWRTSTLKQYWTSWLYFVKSAKLQRLALQATTASSDKAQLATVFYKWQVHVLKSRQQRGCVERLSRLVQAHNVRAAMQTWRKFVSSAKWQQVEHRLSQHAAVQDQALELYQDRIAELLHQRKSSQLMQLAFRSWRQLSRDCQKRRHTVGLLARSNATTLLRHSWQEWRRWKQARHVAARRVTAVARRLQMRFALGVWKSVANEASQALVADVHRSHVKRIVELKFREVLRSNASAVLRAWHEQAKNSHQRKRLLQLWTGAHGRQRLKATFVQWANWSHERRRRKRWLLNFLQSQARRAEAKCFRSWLQFTQEHRAAALVAAQETLVAQHQVQTLARSMLRDWAVWAAKQARLRVVAQRLSGRHKQASMRSLFHTWRAYSVTQRSQRMHVLSILTGQRIRRLSVAFRTWHHASQAILASRAQAALQQRLLTAQASRHSLMDMLSTQSQRDCVRRCFLAWKHAHTQRRAQLQRTLATLQNVSQRKALNSWREFVAARREAKKRVIVAMQRKAFAHVNRAFNQWKSMSMQQALVVRMESSSSLLASARACVVDQRSQHLEQTLLRKTLHAWHHFAAASKRDRVLLGAVSRTLHGSMLRRCFVCWASVSRATARRRALLDRLMRRLHVAHLRAGFGQWRRANVLFLREAVHQAALQLQGSSQASSVALLQLTAPSNAVGPAFTAFHAWRVWTKQERQLKAIGRQVSHVLQRGMAKRAFDAWGRYTAQRIKLRHVLSLQSSSMQRRLLWRAWTRWQISAAQDADADTVSSCRQMVIRVQQHRISEALRHRERLTLRNAFRAWSVCASRVRLERSQRLVASSSLSLILRRLLLGWRHRRMQQVWQKWVTLSQAVAAQRHIAVEAAQQKALRYRAATYHLELVLRDHKAKVLWRAWRKWVARAQALKFAEQQQLNNLSAAAASSELALTAKWYQSQIDALRESLHRSEARLASAESHATVRDVTSGQTMALLQQRLVELSASASESLELKSALARSERQRAQTEAELARVKATAGELEQLARTQAAERQRLWHMAQQLSSNPVLHDSRRPQHIYDGFGHTNGISTASTGGDYSIGDTMMGLEEFDS